MKAHTQKSKSRKAPKAAPADLRNQLEERTRELAEARKHLSDAVEQQRTTSEVLQVISNTRGELEPVFQAILASAVRICEANFGILFEYAEGAFRALSWRAIPADFADFLRQSRVWGTETGLGRLVTTKKPVHVHDARAGRPYEERHADRMAAVELGGVRTFLIVPLLKDGALVGAFSIFRQEVRPFTDAQIALVTTFANQAVIAIENVRLFNEVQAQKRELTEALEHKTATSEILNVISRSPTNAQPVFDAMVESAARLCKAIYAVVWLYDGALLHYVASHNFT